MKKRFMFTAISVLFAAGGIVAGVAAAIKLEKYFHEWIFAIVFGIPGLLIGILAGKKYDAIMKNSLLPHLYSDKPSFNIMFSFVGLSLLAGTWINQGFSVAEDRTYLVVSKEYSPRMAKRTPKYYLIIRTDKGDEQINCNSDYWERKSPGQYIKVVHNKSFIGFDYVELPGEA